MPHENKPSFTSGAATIGKKPNVRPGEDRGAQGRSASGSGSEENKKTRSTPQPPGDPKPDRDPDTERDAGDAEMESNRTNELNANVESNISSGTAADNTNPQTKPGLPDNDPGSKSMPTNGGNPPRD